MLPSNNNKKEKSHTYSRFSFEIAALDLEADDIAHEVERDLAVAGVLNQMAQHGRETRRILGHVGVIDAHQDAFQQGHLAITRLATLLSPRGGNRCQGRR
jgi:hypothetical protein